MRGFEARQHAHLGPAFDLEDADRIGSAQHVIGQGIVLRDRGEVVVLAIDAA